MKKSLSIILSLVMVLSVLVGCGPNRQEASSILLKYAQDSPGAVVVEWTNITPVDDPQLAELSRDIASIGDELLVYMPLPDAPGIIRDPVGFWKKVLIIIHSDETDRERFAKRLADILDKHFDIKAEVSREGETTYITALETKLGVFKDGDYFILSMQPPKRQNPSLRLTHLIDDMLKLGGDLRLGAMYIDASGAVAMKGNSDTVEGILRPGKAAKSVFIPIPDSIPADPDSANLVLAASSLAISDAFHALSLLSQGIIGEPDIPQDVGLAVIGNMETGSAVIAIPGMDPNKLAMVLSVLDISGTKLEEGGQMEGVKLYRYGSAPLYYKNGTIYIFTEPLEPEQAINLINSQAGVQNAQKLRAMLPDTENLALWMKADINLPDISGTLVLTLTGTDSLTMKLKLPKPVDIKTEIYKLMANAKELAILPQTKRQVQQAKASIDILSHYISISLASGIPDDINKLLDNLPDFSRRALSAMTWVDGRPLMKVLRSGNVLMKTGTNSITLCIPVPEVYRVAAGGAYAVIWASPESARSYFSDTCP